MKSLFPLTLQYYLNAVSLSSALSSPQTALRKTRGIWVVCFILGVSGDFLLFPPKDRLLSFFQKTLKFHGKPAPKACAPLCFRWFLVKPVYHLPNIYQIPSVCRRDIEVSKGKLSFQSWPEWESSSHLPLREAWRCWWKSQHRSSQNTWKAVNSLEYLLFARASSLPQEQQLCNLSTQLIALQICLASEITCLCNLILPNVLFRNKSIYHSQIVSFLI